MPNPSSLSSQQLSCVHKMSVEYSAGANFNEVWLPLVKYALDPDLDRTVPHALPCLAVSINSCEVHELSVLVVTYVTKSCFKLIYV